MYIYCDNQGVVRVVSNHILESKYTRMQIPNIPKKLWSKLIGSNMLSKTPQALQDLRIAVICNWNQTCGISTYTNYLIDALKPKVKEIHIFSEEGTEDTNEVTCCWKRGHNMIPAFKKIKAWNPDFVIVQHEFGIFPKATHFLQLLQMLDAFPHVVTLHSVYEHLDKSVCTSAIKNIVVHSQEARDTLRRLGNNSEIFVVPHGCVQFNDPHELWNIFQTPYCILQFGFGFFYKGVDLALRAVAELKRNDPEKYNDIFYCYLCSSNKNTKIVNNDYYEYLVKLTEELDIQENVAIIRKYQTDEALNHYLRTAKLAIFPYITDPNNTVYGASGAIRIAMANGIPVIASKSHLFDDLEGVLPRHHDVESLAKEIDRIFSDGEYRQNLLQKNHEFIEQNTWDKVADRYLKVYQEIF